MKQKIEHFTEEDDEDLSGPSRVISSRAIPVVPLFGELFGICGAMLIQQIHFWCTRKKAQVKVGHSWVYNSVNAWSKQLVVYGESTIRNTLHNLEKQGIVLTGNFNKMGYDKTKWYRLDYYRLAVVLREKTGIKYQVVPIGKTYRVLPVESKVPIPEDQHSKGSLKNKKCLLEAEVSDFEPTPEVKKLSGKVIAMAKGPTSSKLILEQFKTKKSNGPLVKANSAASAYSIWKTIPQHHESVTFMPSMTTVQMAQLKNVVKKLQSMSDKVLHCVVVNWIGYTKFVALQNGLNHKNTPDAPHIAFLLKYVGEAGNYYLQEHASEDEVKAAKGEGQKPLQLIAKPKPIKIVTPAKFVKSASTPSQGHEKIPEPVVNETAQATLEDVMNWKPKSSSKPKQ